jgi:excisionase family DNA binding protein
MVEVKKYRLTIKAVAEALGCTERHVYDLIVEGALDAIKIGSQAVRISDDSYTEFIKKRKINPEDLYDPDIENKQAEQSGRIARSKWVGQIKQ